MQGFVLAAGEGTRLRPLTLDRPKPMLPVSGRPVMEWIIYWLRAAGITEIIANLHYRPDVVQKYFGNGERVGVHLSYSIEETILGTAGGVRAVADRITGPLVVVYGDVLTDLSLAELTQVHESHGEEPHATLSLYRVDNPTQCGIVTLNDEGRVTRFQEKPAADEVFSNLANGGVLVIDRPLIDLIPPGEFYDFSFHLFPRLLEAGIPIYGFEPSPEPYLIDIGSHESYARAQTEWPTPEAAKWVSA